MKKRSLQTLQSSWCPNRLPRPVSQLIGIRPPPGLPPDHRSGLSGFTIKTDPQLHPVIHTRDNLLLSIHDFQELQVHRLHFGRSLQVLFLCRDSKRSRCSHILIGHWNRAISPLILSDGRRHHRPSSASPWQRPSTYVFSSLDQLLSDGLRHGSTGLPRVDRFPLVCWDVGFTLAVVSTAHCL